MFKTEPHLHVAEISMNITATPFNIFKGSFHMPLFMFLSGIFAFKSFKRYPLPQPKSSTRAFSSIIFVIME